ncbi:MAG: site-2 protease family protein [Gemmataceae bacterium]
MFVKRWRICQLFGIPVFIDASWLVILSLLTFTMEANLQSIPALAGLSALSYWVMGAGTALAFFACILLHEMGHALVAQSTGQPVAGITLFLFGGVAEMKSEPTTALREFAMAIAGPLVTVVLALGFGLVYVLAQLYAWPAAVAVIAQYLLAINVVVLVFNMVPAFPLDGGRVLRSILWGAMGNLKRATRIASVCGSAFAWFLIFAGLLSLFGGDPLQGIWLGLIGLFLNNAAQGSYRQVLLREALEGEPLARFMTSQPIVVPPDLDLQHWVDDYVYRYHRKTFPVSSNGDLQGVVSTPALAEIPRNEWHAHTVAEVMQHDFRDITIGPEADAMAALQKMQQTGSSRLLVTDRQAHLVGIVSLKDLMRFLSLKLELEEGNDGD